MKKIYNLIFCLFFCFSLFSCKEKDNVQIFVNSDLKIDINSVEDYMWKAVITIKVNGEDMPYGDTFVTLCDGEELIVGEEAEFIVTYQYNGKKYTKKFILNKFFII